MKTSLIFRAIFIYIGLEISSICAELEFYPGYQRPRIVLNVDNEQTAEEYALEQLTHYLQEQQRQLELRQAEDLASDFQFIVPEDKFIKPEFDFAVAPPNPLYYQITPEDYDFENENDREIDGVIDETKREPDEVPVPAPEPVKKIRSDGETTKPNAVHHLREQDQWHLDQTVEVVPVKPTLQDETAGVYVIAVVAGISAAATVGLIAFAIGWYNLQKNVKNSADVEYPAYGVTGPNKDISPTGDRRLAQSAQMYHYQHQKQQIIAMENRAAATVRHGSMSEAESDEENEEGDYTVYECPGLAPTGEMEVKNPLFQDDPTPAAQPTIKDDHSIPDQK